MSDGTGSTGSAPETGLARWLDPKLVVPLIQAVVVLVLGVWIKDGVTMAIQQKQLDLANVKEMRELMSELLTPDKAPHEYQSAAIALAPFGTYTLGTFMQLVQDGTDNQKLAAQAGLRTVAVTDPKAISGQLRRVVRNRTGLYAWTAHLFAIRTVGQMDDPDALADLVGYRAELRAHTGPDSLERFSRMVSADQPPPPAARQAIVESLNASIEALMPGAGRPR